MNRSFRLLAGFWIQRTGLAEFWGTLETNNRSGRTQGRLRENWTTEVDPGLDVHRVANLKVRVQVIETLNMFIALEVV